MDRLVTLGVSVRVADDLSSGKLANLPDSLDGIEFIKGNLRDQSVIGQNAFEALTKCVQPG